MGGKGALICSKKSNLSADIADIQKLNYVPGNTVVTKL